MDWVKLRTGYYLDAAIEEVGEPAEILFVRALAWCGHQENGGFVPTKMLPRLTPTRGAARARALVAHGLWITVEGGFQITSWDRHQTHRDRLEEKRESGRLRAAKHRERARNAVTNGVSNDEVTQREVEEEVEAACSSSREPLPPPLEILKSRLDAAGLRVRWDTLKPAQADTITAALDKHGDAALVAAARGQHRPDDPAKFVTAWLRLWTHGMPKPGSHLGLVSRGSCEIHNQSFNPAGLCSSCAADQIVGDR